MGYNNSMTPQNHPVDTSLSFTGFDINAIDTQSTSLGSQKPVFKLRDELSYYIPQGQVVEVPDGFLYDGTPATVTHAQESLVSSASEASNQTSWTVGVSAGGAGTGKGGSPEGSGKAAGGSASFGMSTLNEFSQDKSSLLAITDSVSMQSRMILDKPNATLDDEFASDLDTLIRGPSPTQAKYIVDHYGTHYPNSLGYGGRALKLRKVSTTEFADTVSKDYNASASGTFRGVTASVDYSNSQTNSNTTSNSFSSEDYSSVGSTGSMDASGFHVSVQTQVPVLFDLRPLDGLISPLFFPQYPMAKLQTAKTALQAAIADHIAKAPKLDTTSHFPDMFQVKVSGITCINAYNTVNQLEGSSKIYGKLSFYYSQSPSESANPYMWQTDAPVPATCDGHSEFASGATYIVAVEHGANTSVNWHAEFGQSEPFVDHHAWGDGAFDPRDPAAAHTFQVTQPNAPIYLFTATVTKIPLE
ncbi:MAG: hypothetical protein JOZ05_01110 [Acetobacteraceae bacterium]|nr:hypothetical protein [Acetobacteraceae bacterium]